MKRSKSTKEEVVTGTLTVGEVEHSLKLTCTPDTLAIQVQNMRSGESWQNSFPSALLEKITSKTGNYKHFAVFVEMLTAAVTHSSDSVEVELLTYADLVSLKTGKKQSNPKSGGDNKKYLILTYTVQFDTVHYPLPLPYAGKIGTAELQSTVSKLQSEIDELKVQIVSPHNACCKDNAALKEEVLLLREREKACNTLESSNRDAVEMAKALRHLEQDMIREKNKYQKALDKKSGEVRKLVDEVESLRSTNRTLTVRLRSISTELSVAKGSRSTTRGRGYLNSSSNNSSPASRSNHSASRSNHSASRSNTKSRPRSAPNSARSTPGSAQSGRSTGRSTGRNPVRGDSRGRSESRESVGVFSRKRASSRGSSSGPSEVRIRARTPSPAGARFPRFDPSAYIKDKQDKLTEAKSSRDRESRARTHLPRARSTPLSNRQSPSTSIYHRPPPSSVVQDIIKGNLLSGRSRRSNSVSSVDSQFSYTSNNGSNRSNRSNNGSNRSKQSNASKQSNRSNVSKQSNRSNRPKKQKAKYSYPTSGSELSDKENSKRGHYLNTPPVDLTLDQSNVSFTKDSEIAEIDARLNALQTYLRDAKNKQYAS